MKNKILILVGYFSLVFFARISIIREPMDLLGCMNILFLNFESFPQYGFDSMNFMSMIYFMLLYTLILSMFLEVKNEVASYLSLIVYRQNKKSAVYYRVKCHLKAALTLLFLTSLVLLVLTVIFVRKIEVSDVLLMIIYFVRFYGTFVFIGVMVDLLSIMGHSIKANFFVHFIYVGFSLIDLFNQSHIISFSGAFNSEILMLGIEVSIALIVIAICMKFYERGGDIL